MARPRKPITEQDALIADLKQAVADRDALLDTAKIATAELAENFARTKATGEAWKKRADDLEKEAMALRAELHGNELRHAQLQGYLKARSDMEPPVMVPAVQRPFGADLINDFAQADFDDGIYRAGREPPRRWFNRPL